MQNQILICIALGLLSCGEFSCIGQQPDQRNNSFAIYFLKPKEQAEVWRYATFLVDLDELEIEGEPFVTETDIESFDQHTIRLNHETTLPTQPPGTGLLFVIVVGGKREVIGQFLSPRSSLSPDDATTIVMNDKVKEIRIPQHSKGLNSYLRTLYKQRKYR